MARRKRRGKIAVLRHRDGMRVLVSTVAFSSERLVIIAAIVIAKPSQGPPISRAAWEKYPVCHFSQSRARQAKTSSAENRWRWRVE